MPDHCVRCYFPKRPMRSCKILLALGAFRNDSLGRVSAAMMIYNIVYKKLFLRQLSIAPTLLPLAIIVAIIVLIVWGLFIVASIARVVIVTPGPLLWVDGGDFVAALSTVGTWTLVKFTCKLIPGNKTWSQWGIGWNYSTLSTFFFNTRPYIRETDCVIMRLDCPMPGDNQGPLSLTALG